MAQADCEPISAARVRRRLLVHGIVQGVGFRPYVYRLAMRTGLVGFVRNTSLGVLIEVEGKADAVASFEVALPNEGPPLMRVDSMESQTLPLNNDNGFAILKSEHGKKTLAWVPADVASCVACIEDTNDPRNRRHKYAFTNCTNCGPRYSIILDLPYDRAQTTMSGFEMCDACRQEYEDPTDRRFHAQPNACPECGPHLYLTDACGKTLPIRDTVTILSIVVNMLRTGGIVAWKGLGGYQLACDARNESAVQELRKRKHRNDKAFAVMVHDLSAVEALCVVSDEERVLLSGARKPIVLLQKRSGARLADNVSPCNGLLGVMLPYTPMHELLFRALEEEWCSNVPLVMTSGNLSEEPIVIEEAEAHHTLSSVTDIFVDHNRPIHTRVDDSVICVFEGREILIRRARGYTPTPIPLSASRNCPHLLACGAQQKSTLCLAKDGFAILSQHLGDLENYETLTFFEQTLDRMKRLFQVNPEVVAHDLHPGYLSTQFARKLNLEKRVEIQHHHAHIASCMAEHQIDGSVIGIAWDGTGFGSDGTIWGGEFFVGNLARFDRYAHFRNILLVGGDQAIREPWRVARSYLRDSFDSDFLRGIAWQSFVPDASARRLDVLLEKRIQTIETSSCGRLFDAVAALIGLHQMVTYEGQAAMALEAIADSADQGYDFAIEGQMPWQVDMRPMIRQIVEQIESGQSPGTIAARFHNTLVSIVADVCARIRQNTGLARVCLSGGCFQNVRLLSGCLHALRSAGFEVFFQQQIPCNDGGIALGQAAIASELMRKRA